MRLRYLHLPRCGPLNDAAIVFGREDLISEALNLKCQGTLNFVVGVNGTGKSFLMRAIYGVFRSLMRREWPSLPATLAWNRKSGSETVTALFHYPGRKSDSFLATFEPVPDSARRGDWENLTEALVKDQSSKLVKGIKRAISTDIVGSSLLMAMLPKRLIAYTSGVDDLWSQLDHPSYHLQDEEEQRHQIEDERPQGWDIDQEWEEQHPICMSNIMTHLGLGADRETTLSPSLSGATKTGERTRETLNRLREDIEPLDVISKKVAMNRMSQSNLAEAAYLHVQPRALRFSGVILGLWQTAKELSGKVTERQRDTLRNVMLQQIHLDKKPKDARRVLNEIDWFWPTHLSLTYHDTGDRTTRQQRQELLCLVAQADEVVAQPLNRKRAVISLSPSDQINLTEKMEDSFPLGIPDKKIEEIAKRVDGSKTGAEAILRIFSEDDEIDSTPMDVFLRLRDWDRTGLLEDITLTVKRLHKSINGDEESDDIIITYDQLSDGEQMLLGRMGLIFLLRGQDGSLLLLDEPETHFNDVWKREIVEMVDTGLLNSTAANVIISTHTSIALTDVFAAEVTVLDKQEDGITARGVTGGLFGTDPGEVTMNLFRAESSIGRRSVELLDRLLKTEWEGREKELEAILDVLGSSFHRAELRAVLKQLRDKKDDITPH
jgi:hypothetical protein